MFSISGGGVQTRQPPPAYAPTDPQTHRRGRLQYTAAAPRSAQRKHANCVQKKQNKCGYLLLQTPVSHVRPKRSVQHLDRFRRQDDRRSATAACMQSLRAAACVACKCRLWSYFVDCGFPILYICYRSYYIIKFERDFILFNSYHNWLNCRVCL